MNIFSRFINSLIPERRDDGTYWYPLNGTTSYQKLSTYEQKLIAVLSNPALCKVISLNCDLFSLAEIKIVRNGKDVDDPLLWVLNNPNPFQTRRQWLWDYMFWNMLGCSYMLSDSKIVENKPFLYWLNNSKIDIPQTLINKFGDQHIWSIDTFNELQDEKINYRYHSGTKSYTLGEIKIFPDLTNNLGNWFDSPSRIDALYKIIENSESALDSKNVNLHFSKKFMVAGKQDPENIHELPLSTNEKRSIERSTLSRNPVTAVKSMIDIRRYVDDMAKLKLDDAYDADLMNIGNMYNIPKEILDVLKKGSTYENQEKAIGRHIGYSIQPKGDDLANGIETYFGYDKKKRDIFLSWDHLPFMQVFEADRAEVNKKNAETFKIMVDSGITPESAIKLLKMEVEFKEIEDETIEPIGEVDTTA